MSASLNPAHKPKGTGDDSQASLASMITGSPINRGKADAPPKSSVLGPNLADRKAPKPPPTAPPPARTRAAGVGSPAAHAASATQLDQQPAMVKAPPATPPAGSPGAGRTTKPKPRRPSRADIVAPARRSQTVAAASASASMRAISLQGEGGVECTDTPPSPASPGTAGGPRSRSLADLGGDDAVIQRADTLSAHDAVSAASALGATSAGALRSQLLEGAKSAHKALTKRQHLLRELLTSEHQFVMWMRVFQETFGAALEAQTEPWTQQLLADKAAAILLNTHKNIFEWNGRLLHSLQDLLNDAYTPGADVGGQEESMVTNPPALPQPYACVGQLVMQHAELFGLYGSYADMHESSAATVDKLVLQDEAAAAALSAVAALPACKGQDIRSFLIMPVQRIPRYRMLLSETAKCTERAAAAMRTVAAARETLLLTAGAKVEEASTAIAAQELQGALDTTAGSDTRRNVLLLSKSAFAAHHADLELEADSDLPNALHQTDRAAKHMNTAIARRLARQALKDLESKFVGGLPLVSPQRRLVREGRLLKVCRRFDKTYYWHLFNDALLYSEETRTGSASFKVHRIMSLAETWVEPISPAHNSAKYAPPHALRVLNRSKSFIVAAETVQDKAMWLRDLSATIIRAHTEVVNSRLGGGGSDASTAPGASELFSHSTADTEHASGSSAGVGVEKLTLAAAKGVSEYTATVRASAAPVFIPDHVQPSCSCCDATFSVMFCPRHHCRLCGVLVCAACSKTRLILPHVDAKVPQRICDKCQQNNVAGDASTVKLQVTVIDGRDLPSSDSNGHSDPYVRLFHGGIQCGETPVVKKTLNPTWDPHTATFEVPLRYLSKGAVGAQGPSQASVDGDAEPSSSQAEGAEGDGTDPVAGSGITAGGGSLVLECWDRDVFSSDDFLGRVGVKVQRVLRRLVATRRAQQRAARAKARELAASDKRRATTLSSRGGGVGRHKGGAHDSIAVPRLHTDFALSLLGVPEDDCGITLKLPLSELGVSATLREASSRGARAPSTVAFDSAARASSALPRLQLSVRLRMPEETSTAEDNPLRLIRQWAVAAVPLLPASALGTASSTPPPERHCRERDGADVLFLH